MRFSKDIYQFSNGLLIGYATDRTLMCPHSWYEPSKSTLSILFSILHDLNFLLLQLVRGILLYVYKFPPNSNNLLINSSNTNTQSHPISVCYCWSSLYVFIYWSGSIIDWFANCYHPIKYRLINRCSGILCHLVLLCFAVLPFYSLMINWCLEIKALFTTYTVHQSD